jgi:nucleoid-associated protein YgaU
VTAPVATGSSYTVVEGDWLAKIAQRHYGDWHKWTLIYAANRDVIGSNPNLIYPGQVLTLP